MFNLMIVIVLQKVQRNGLAVDLDEELKPAEARNQNQKQKQNPSESPDPAGGKSDKVYGQGQKQTNH